MIKNYLKKIRACLLLTFKYKFKKVGSNLHLSKNLHVRANSVSVGDNVFIGPYVRLSLNEIFIDDYSMLASYSSIVGGDHKFDVVGTPMRFSGRNVEKKVIIEKDVWVGHRSIIMHGVRLSEGSVIAAGSVVTKDVEPYTIVAGVPAKFIRYRFSSKLECIQHSQKIKGSFHNGIN